MVDEHLGAMKAIFALGCGLELLVMLYDAVSCPPPHRAICVNNLKQIALALHNYHEKYGTFPPAFIADEIGRPMHSWRVLLLPFLEEQSLYEQYDFREPWDSPKNINLLGKMPQFFACPSWSSSRTDLASYVAITDPGTMFPGVNSVDLGQVSDGNPNTLMIVEVQNVDIPWTAPLDLDLRTMSFMVNDPQRPGISSRHPGGVNVAFVDGRVSYMREGVSPDALRALITIAGGEKLEVDEALDPS
jgi:prepilin-type processing-associated H-X9-DG protein